MRPPLTDTPPHTGTLVTRGFTPLGWAGAALFVLSPTAFLVFSYLIAQTTAIEETTNLGGMTIVAIALTLASVPLMLVGRYEIHIAE